MILLAVIIVLMEDRHWVMALLLSIKFLFPHECAVCAREMRDIWHDYTRGFDHEEHPET